MFLIGLQSDFCVQQVQTELKKERHQVVVLDPSELIRSGFSWELGGRGHRVTGRSSLIRAVCRQHESEVCYSARHGWAPAVTCRILTTPPTWRSSRIARLRASSTVSTCQSSIDRGSPRINSSRSRLAWSAERPLQVVAFGPKTHF
jgi:hypothetical protein